MSLAKVAIVMATYNGERFIEAALKSLLRQRDVAELDIIVVDDGSTDSTVQIVQSIAKGGNIRLLQAAHRGPGPARNLALKAITTDTDFVGFLDCDDLSAKSFIADQLARFAQRPELEMIFGATEYFREADPGGLEPRPGSKTLRIRTVVLACILFRRDLITRTGLFDESFQSGEDGDYLLRVFEQQPNYLVIDEVVHYYRRHDRNMTLDKEQFRKGLARALMLAARRRMKGAPPLPPGIFDPAEMDEISSF